MSIVRLRVVPSAVLCVSTLLLFPCAAALRAQQPAEPQLLQHGMDDGEPDEQAGWSNHIRAMLVAGQFDELDRIADKFRRERTRMPGGDWRLHHFYKALDRPYKNDQDTLDHLARLSQWMKQRPESPTPRIALAVSLHRWAWVARGNGMANTVTPERWKQFEDRHQQAMHVLDSSQKIAGQDPQYFLVMMEVGQAFGWDNGRVREYMDRGLQVEPEYFYLQQHMVNYLLPKWNGEKGDSSRFVTNQADRLGGERGDELYFQLASVLIKRGDGNFPVRELDWARIQRGFRALSTQFGATKPMQNQLAFMAYKYGDAETARAQFALIGDGWVRGVWRDRAFFDRIRDWSRGLNG